MAGLYELDRKRNTPAEAGKTFRVIYSALKDQKHPRRGGEDLRTKRGCCDTRETPPPRRGRLSRFACVHIASRNTPAEAGKTPHAGPKRRALRKHPRRGGEDDHIPQPSKAIQETPPPRRGRPKEHFKMAAYTGNTPAEAGKTL